MSLYKKSGATKELINYVQYEETYIYAIDSKEKHEKLFKRLNKQIGCNYFKVEKVIYPYVFVLDFSEVLDAVNKKLCVK